MGREEEEVDDEDDDDEMTRDDDVELVLFLHNFFTCILTISVHLFLMLLCTKYRIYFVQISSALATLRCPAPAVAP